MIYTTSKDLNANDKIYYVFKHIPKIKSQDGNFDFIYKRLWQAKLVDNYKNICYENHTYHSRTQYW